MAPAAKIADLADVVRFVLEVDKLKGIVRKVRPVGEDRYENAAEHNWQIALFGLSLARTLKLAIDVNRAVAMLLMHDIGEIDAGTGLYLRRTDGRNERPQSSERSSESPALLQTRRLGSCSVYGRSSTPEKLRRPALPKD
jgi:putative hydrolase of HD superfamily